VAAALDIVDEHGLDALTLARVAARSGVAAPSLYKHVRNIAELHALVGAHVIEEMTQRFTAAVLGRSGDEAVAALMHTYRAYAVKHPARYAAMPMDPLHDPAMKEAGSKQLQVILATLREYGLDGPAAIHATRRLRVIVHGFASIETGGGFGLPEDLDETYEQLIQMYLTDLAREN
jgi:AcrR family transcriptional regulator